MSEKPLLDDILDSELTKLLDSDSGRIEAPPVTRSQPVRKGVPPLPPNHYPFLAALSVVYQVIAILLFVLGVICMIVGLVPPEDLLIKPFVFFIYGLCLMTIGMVTFCSAEGNKMMINIANDIHDARNFLARK